MKNSKDKRVQQLLRDFEALGTEKYAIIQRLRKIVFATYPRVSERVMYGGIMFSLDEDFGGVFVNKHHVSFEFGNGFRMSDPKNFLEGKGKFRRHLKIRSMTDIEAKEVEFFVNQAI